MADFGREIRFGYFLVPTAGEPLLDTAVEVERLGFDLIGVQDHPYQRRFVETFSLLAMILARTTRVTVFPDVANLPLRPPAVLAKAAASLDLLSGGRFELGGSVRAASSTRSRPTAVRAGPRARRCARWKTRSPSSVRCGAASAICASTGSSPGWPGPTRVRSRRTRSACGSAPMVHGRCG